MVERRNPIPTPCRPDSELGEYRVHNLDELHLVKERVRSHYVSITLIELTVSALLRTVCTPHGLNLEATERQLYLLSMLYDIACERHGKVKTESLLTEL
jgi:hypothetical protein